ASGCNHWRSGGKRIFVPGKIASAHGSSLARDNTTGSRRRRATASARGNAIRSSLITAQPVVSPAPAATQHQDCPANQTDLAHIHPIPAAALCPDAATV